MYSLAATTITNQHYWFKPRPPPPNLGLPLWAKCYWHYQCLWRCCTEIHVQGPMALLFMLGLSQDPNLLLSFLLTLLKKQWSKGIPKSTPGPKDKAIPCTSCHGCRPHNAFDDAVNWCQGNNSLSRDQRILSGDQNPQQSSENPYWSRMVILQAQKL